MEESFEDEEAFADPNTVEQEIVLDNEGLEQQGNALCSFFEHLIQFWFILDRFAG